MLPNFELVQPSSRDEAFAALAEGGVPYCGGTELLLAMRAGLLAPDVLVDTKRLPGAAEIVLTQDWVSIGAAVTHARVIENPVIRECLPFLVEVESHVANPRVRNQGSLVGNLCFAEPKSDIITAMIALAASVEIASADGTREVPVQEFIQGPYEAGLDSAELVAGIKIPAEKWRTSHGVYIKFQPRERPTAAVAVFSDGARVRTVVGAAGELPVWRDGEECSEDVIDYLVDALDPIDDLAGSPRYKVHIVRTLLARAIDTFRQSGR